MHCVQLPRQVVSQSGWPRQEIFKRRLLYGFPFLAAAIAGIEIFLEEAVHIDLIEEGTAFGFGSGFCNRSVGCVRSPLALLFLTRDVIDQGNGRLELLEHTMLLHLSGDPVL